MMWYSVEYKYDDRQYVIIDIDKGIINTFILSFYLLNCLDSTFLLKTYF